MRNVGGTIELSAADLIGHLGCRHLTQLELAVAFGKQKPPKIWDPLLELLWERGLAHEKQGNKAQAILDFQSALQLVSDYALAKQALEQVT